MEVLRLREFRLLLRRAGRSRARRPDGADRARLRGARARRRRRPRSGSCSPARISRMIATLLIGGVVADRVSRRAVMVVADVARVAHPGADGGAADRRRRRDLDARACSPALTGAAGGFFNPAATGADAGDRARASSCSRPTGCGRPRCRPGRSPARRSPGVLIAAVGAGLGAGRRRRDVRRSARRSSLALQRCPRPSSATATSFLADLREGWGVFTLADVGVGVRGRRGGREPALGAWAVLGPGGRRAGRSAAPPRGASCSRALGVGALARRADRGARQAAATAACSASATLRACSRSRSRCWPRAAPVGVIAAGAVLARASAMMLGNAVWESTLQAHVPARVALARERVRLVRLARVQPAGGGDLGADRGADRHLGRALDLRGGDLRRSRSSRTLGGSSAARVARRSARVMRAVEAEHRRRGRPDCCSSSSVAAVDRVQRSDGRLGILAELDLPRELGEPLRRRPSRCCCAACAPACARSPPRRARPPRAARRAAAASCGRRPRAAAPPAAGSRRGRCAPARRRRGAPRSPALAGRASQRSSTDSRSSTRSGLLR